MRERASVTREPKLDCKGEGGAATSEQQRGSLPCCFRSSSLSPTAFTTTTTTASSSTHTSCHPTALSPCQDSVFPSWRAALPCHHAGNNGHTVRRFHNATSGSSSPPGNNRRYCSAILPSPRPPSGKLSPTFDNKKHERAGVVRGRGKYGHNFLRRHKDTHVTPTPLPHHLEEGGLRHHHSSRVTSSPTPGLR
ncbi:hypothetical protein E2C01_024356 [Portunus trituberculatus]|uniref:Uncharacterized protein n=1 Tax=Portunus trituberculatus TaxID=210409 RepID=A0A5B7ECL7_PORTR|nr:hypothetical protein [Portunus trituberculatus]